MQNILGEDLVRQVPKTLNGIRWIGKNYIKFLMTDVKELEALFSEENFKEDYKILNREIRKLGYNIPPLVNAYMNLSPTMKVFGTAINDEFGDVEETGILITINDIYPEKRQRHIETYIEQK